MGMTSQDWKTSSEAHAFLGNSLLAPMSRTGKVGLDPGFWAAFPTFGDAGVESALAACTEYARAASELDREQAAQNVCVEYTRLFIGPPSPAAPPWETMYEREGANAGFGEATFQMRAALKDLGLALSNKNNQFEDHLGIELLYLSELCARRADGRIGEGDEAIAGFIAEHPLSWIGAFEARIADVYPKGYYSALVGLTIALLNAQASML